MGWPQRGQILYYKNCLNRNRKNWSHEAWIKLTLLKLLTLSKVQANLAMHSLNSNIHAVRVANNEPCQ